MESNPRPQFAILTGQIKTGSWSRGYRFLPTNTEETQEKGTLLVNLALSSLDKVDLDLLGSQLATAIHEGYFQSETGNISDNLKKALENHLLKLKELLPRMEVHSLQTQLALAVVRGEGLYLAKSGHEKVMLKRGGLLQPINFSRVATGKVQVGDWLFLATDNFWKVVSPEDLLRTLNDQDFEQTLKKIDQLIGDKEDVSCTLAYFGTAQATPSPKNILVDPNITKKLTPLTATVGVKLQKYLKILLNFMVKLVTIYFPTLIKNILKRSRKGKNDVPLGQRSPKTKKKSRFLLLLLIIIFSLGLFINLFFKNIKTNQARGEELLKQAQQNYENAQSLQTLNVTKAKELLLEAQEKITESKKITNKKDKTLIEKDIEGLLATLRREYRLAQLPLFYDLSDLKSNIEISSLSFNGTNLVALDKKVGSLLALDLKAKKGSVLITDETLIGAGKLVVASNIGYILKSNSILRFDFAKSAFLKPISLNEEVNDFSIYNSNLYILTTSNLKKAVLSSDGATSFNSYLNDKSLDLKEAKGVVVDGFVWVLTDNNLFKLSLGKREDFSLSGLEKKLAHPQALFSNETTNYLYILDKENGRLVVIDKNGSYYSQYITPQIEEIAAMYADESSNRLYLAGKEKIYLVEIQKKQ